jgi:esterase/lipase superfamily enzyme
METQYFKDYSPALGREMECKVYGHAGRPMLFIPCQDGRFFDFEDFHMAGTLAPWIESGQIMVISIDTIDQETWSDTNGDPYWRSAAMSSGSATSWRKSCPRSSISPRSATAGTASPA